MASISVRVYRDDKSSFEMYRTIEDDVSIIGAINNGIELLRQEKARIVREVEASTNAFFPSLHPEWSGQDQIDAEKNLAQKNADAEPAAAGSYAEYRNGIQDPRD